MRNLKFGVFCLGLLVAIATAVSSLSAQARVPFDLAQGRQVEPRSRGNLMVLDGRGAQLGVMVSDPSTRQSPQADPGSLRAGVVVDDVNPDSPAEKAGIKAGDLIVEYDGERVRSARQFTRLVQETPEGRTVKIGLLRDGKRQTVDATPESRTTEFSFRRDPGAGNREPQFHMRELPDFNFDFDDRLPRRFEYRLPEGFRVPAPGSPFPSSRGRFGVSVQSITPELAEYFGAKNGGALVSSVTRDSAAAKAGVKAGDVITSINGRSVRDSDDLVRELDSTSGEATVVVLRDRKEMTLKATIEQRRPATPRAGSRPGI